MAIFELVSKSRLHQWILNHNYLNLLVMSLDQRKLRIFIIDDHQLVLDGLKMMIDSSEELAFVGLAQSGEAGLRKLNQLECDALLLDIEMPGMNGIEVCKKVTAKFPDVKVVALTMLMQPSIIEAMTAAGAHGFLAKNTSMRELTFAVKEVCNGFSYFSKEIQEILDKGIRIEGTQTQIPKLSKREKEITQLILDSLNTREIAEKLFISHGTVETHRKNIMRKLGVKNSAGLVKMVLEHRLLS